MREYLIIDGHLDMAFNALFYRRDLTQSVYVLREREDSMVGGLSAHPDSLAQRLGPQPKRFTPTVCLPEMRKGRVGIMLSTIMCRVQNPQDNTHNAVRTQDVAYARGQSHLAYYRALERCGEIRFIKSVVDLNACVADWENPADDTPVGLILSMESADPILGPDQVGEWYEAGLRSVSLTHFGANTYGHGTGTVGGLYPPAYALMDALSETDIALDLTHAADLTFWHILDYWKGPVHASHCNCRALVPGQRHLSDDMIRAITDRGGVIGMVFAEQMLSPAWNWDDPRTHYTTATRPMKAVLEHIDHICELTGSTDYVAYGTDLDGGFGLELSPTDYHTIDDLQRFLNLMRVHGYGEDDVKGFAHGNLVRFFTTAWDDMSDHTYFIVDSHLDLAFCAIQVNRDLTQPAATVRVHDSEPTTRSFGSCTTTFPELHRGRVGIVFGTVMSRIDTNDRWTRTGMWDQTQCYGIGMGHYAFYKAMERRGIIRQIHSVEDLDACVAAWAHPSVDTPIGLVLAMESADPILDPDQVPEWRDLGLKMVSISHYGVSSYCHGTGTEGGLLDRGRPLLDALKAAGIIVDLTHTTDQAFWEILDYYDGPVAASHHNCRALTPGQRQLTDDMIRAIVERGGVIGAAFDAWMLDPEWKRGVPCYEQTTKATLETVVNHIDHVCQLAGNANHSGIGTDLDGGYGQEQSPRDLNTIADLQNLVPIFERRGYSQEDIQKVLSGNWVRLLKSVWRR